MKIVVPGKPIAKKRPRFFRRGNFVGTYNSQETEEGRWLHSAQSQVEYKVIVFPIQVIMDFYLPIPKSTSKKKRQEMLIGNERPVKKPDIDNLEKFCLDCLNGVAWDDDCQVVKMVSEKHYSDNPRTEIEIVEI